MIDDIARFRHELKVMSSYRGIIPSEDMDTFDYLLWLELATVDELRRDVLTQYTSDRVKAAKLGLWP